MISQQSSIQVGAVLEILEGSSRVAQQIGTATGLLAQRFGITPERAWSLLVRLSQNCHVKVRDIAQALINAHCGQLDPAEVDIISAIQCHLPDGVRLIDAPAASARLPSERPR